jgi:four helix bundle protein
VCPTARRAQPQPHREPQTPHPHPHPNPNPNPRAPYPIHPPQLPHHKLLAYRVALEMLIVIKAAYIRDPKLRDQAMRAAKSAALNVAEAAGRVSPADRARVFGIARGEAMEAAAALEIAVVAGDAERRSLDALWPIANRLVALLSGLCR